MRIVLTTFGSLGDLHPYLAIAIRLKERGHAPVLATLPQYRAKIEREGIEFHAIRPDPRDLGPEETWIARAMDLRKGSEFVVRRLVIPFLRESYEDLDAAAEGADALLSHPLTFTAPLVAEKRELPWAASVLAPLGFFSAWDPPILPGIPLLGHTRRLGPSFQRFVFSMMRRSVSAWTAPVAQLRRELGLPAANGEPMFEGQFSPHANLALFSRVLATPQRDWPVRTHVTGFPYFDRDEGTSEDVAAAGALERFLAAGPPPVVFTLGSSAVWDAGRFYEESAAAARTIGERAVLLVGKDARNRPGAHPPEIHVAAAAPYSTLFPRARAIVHQGGIGTTAQALRAGRPMLVVPHAHDQPDNADRVRRLGVAAVLRRDRYTAGAAARALSALLADPALTARAREVGDVVREENGTDQACAVLERLGTASPGASSTTRGMVERRAARAPWAPGPPKAL